MFLTNYFKNVYVFEPNPITYEVLKINWNFAVKRKNITPLNVRLSDRKGSLTFHINRLNMSGSKIIYSNNGFIKDAISYSSYIDIV